MLGQIRSIEHLLDPVELGHSLTEISAKPEPRTKFSEDLKIRLRLAQGLDAFMLHQHHSMVHLCLAMQRITAGTAEFADVVAFVVGARRQQNIGILGLTLEPDRLVDDKRQLVGPVGFDVAVGIVHRPERGPTVLVEHLDGRMSGLRIAEFLELAFDRLAIPGVALRLAVEDRLGNLQPRHFLRRCIERRELRHAQIQADPQGSRGQVAGHAAIGIAREGEAQIDGRAPLEQAVIDARFAYALHGHQAGHGARPLNACGRAAGAAVTIAPTTRAQIGLPARPAPRQCAHFPGRNAGLQLLPFGRLRDAILDAQQVIAPFIETQAAIGNEFLVVGVFGNPYVGDCHAHRRIGRRLRCNPLAAKQSGGMVEVRIDMNDFDAHFLQPLAAWRAFVRRIRTAGGFRIGRPEHDHFGFLHQVLDQAIGLDLAQAHAIAVVVHRAPIPTFPTVRVVHHLGGADGVEKLVGSTEVITNISPGMVRTMVAHDRALTEITLYALDFRSDDIERLVPTDPDIAGNAAILAIALAVGIEVDALHRIEQAIRRIYCRLLANRMRGHRRLTWRRPALAARLDGPGGRVGVIKFYRRQPDYLAVFDMHESRTAVGIGDIPFDAIAQVGAVLPMQRRYHVQRLGEPDHQVVTPIGLQLKALDRFNALDLIDMQTEQAQAELGIGDRDLDVGRRMQAPARNDFAILESKIACDRIVFGAHLCGKILLRKAQRKFRMAARHQPQSLQEAPQKNRELDVG